MRYQEKYVLEEGDSEKMLRNIVLVGLNFKFRVKQGRLMCEVVYDEIIGSSRNCDKLGEEYVLFISVFSYLDFGIVKLTLRLVFELLTVDFCFMQEDQFSLFVLLRFQKVYFRFIVRDSYVEVLKRSFLGTWLVGWRRCCFLRIEEGRGFRSWIGSDLNFSFVVCFGMCIFFL